MRGMPPQAQAQSAFRQAGPQAPGLPPNAWRYPRPFRTCCRIAHTKRNMANHGRRQRKLKSGLPRLKRRGMSSRAAAQEGRRGAVVRRVVRVTQWRRRAVLCCRAARCSRVAQMAAALSQRRCAPGASIQPPTHAYAVPSPNIQNPKPFTSATPAGRQQTGARRQRTMPARTLPYSRRYASSAAMPVRAVIRQDTGDR